MNTSYIDPNILNILRKSCECSVLTLLTPKDISIV